MANIYSTNINTTSNFSPQIIKHKKTTKYTDGLEQAQYGGGLNWLMEVTPTPEQKTMFQKHLKIRKDFTRALPEEKMTSQKHLNINKDFTRALPEEKMISHF